MKKTILAVLSVSILFFSPNLAVSDCTDFGRVTNWSAQDENTIIYFNQNTPVAKIDLRDCKVNSSSNIRLTKNYMCDGDTIIIDGQECSIGSLTLQ